MVSNRRRFSANAFSVDVPEEDTTEGGESAEQVGFPRDGGLDAVDIVGGSQRRATSRHDGRGLEW